MIWAALGLMACGSDKPTPTEMEPDPPVATTIVVSPSSLTLEIEETGTLGAEVKDQRGQPMPSAVVTWASADPAVASVDSDGLVTALAPGSTTITATSGSVEGEVSTTVAELMIAAAPLAAGESHACALATTGEAYCWGGNGLGMLGNGSSRLSGSPTPVSGAHTYRQISAGPIGNHTCGLTADGRVYCWGDNYWGEVSPFVTERSVYEPVLVDVGHTVVQVAVARYHSCALTTTGEAYCWGLNDHGHLGNGTLSESGGPDKVDAPAPFESIAAGRNHTCGLDGSGLAYCWGFNQYGGVGQGVEWDNPIPTLVSSTHHFDQIAGGDGFTCARSDGDVYCWGSNSQGQLGGGGGAEAGVPSLVPGLSDIVFVEAGTHYACALDEGGAAYCWGGNYNRQLGAGDGADSELVPPTEVVGGHSYQYLALGDQAACGLGTDETVYCWGSNPDGQLGDGHPPVRFQPELVSGGLQFDALFAGGVSTCGLDSAGDLYCWGRLNGVGWEPLRIDGGLRFQQVDLDLYHACGLTTGGGAYCWGRQGDFGMLGNGSSSDSDTPVPVTTDSTFATIATGDRFSCASSGTYSVCWGDGQHGEFGTAGGAWNGSTPVEAIFGIEPTRLVAGVVFGCGLEDTGTASCWGSSLGALGSSSPDPSSPYPVDGGHTFTRLVSSHRRACGLDGSGVAWCWGGVSSGIPRYPPEEIAFPGTFVDIATGDGHGCAVDDAGSVYCWGLNSVGQRGDDSALYDSDTPGLVSLPGTAVQVVDGASHSCALMSDGSTYCWGENLNGQLGVEFNPTSTARSVVPF
ncbi:MAG: Ig-like domain-containing protein [Gemmatimonadota bacterium]